ncbi:hypothetical protein CY34DRAFT_300063 [Suillus luteus UH-Slu-Lm8-n1]|uniref:Uncharacterized protein n=1 Tax=Suillus luteus UH-Slu-Lm8-n1 TaxID=930992 RepID=A0A0D0B7V1_9AGAM|nr:hypothetical protein CY34DRAFT_300063 [Suillus luteus UH-Slu-Lm8-n1]
MAVVTLVYGHHSTGNAINTTRLWCFELASKLQISYLLCSDHLSLSHMTALIEAKSPLNNLANSIEGIGTNISKIKPIFTPRTYLAYSNTAYTAICRIFVTSSR